MSTGVFGTPLTVDTVRSMALYREPITQRNCADYAMEMMSGGDGEKNAVQYVENLKDKYGTGVSTRCLIYNATGTTLQLIKNKNFHGQVHDKPYPGPYIMNGQWAGFLHVHPKLGWGYGSAGAVVYRALRPNHDNWYCDWIYSWLVPFAKGNNRVYTRITDSADSINWDDFYLTLEDSEENTRFRDDTVYNSGYLAQIQIGQGTSVEARGVIQMAPNN